jgi:hypothetical protein
MVSLNSVSRKTIRRFALAAALVVPAALIPTAQAHAGIFIQVAIAPPVLPVYAQPECPGDGYIWTPGYWAYIDDGGYYWVPGVWVEPPTVGYLWTPAYWGWEDGFYRFHDGYWGEHVGFYGGINYGFGYGGIGFVGGEWRGGHFYYNSAVVNFGGRHFDNVYVNREVVVHNTIVNTGHTSFNGGHGGIDAHPRPEEMAAARENHVQPTGAQTQHQSFSGQNRSQFASANGGHPGTTAASTPGAFHNNASNAGAANRGGMNENHGGAPGVDNRGMSNGREGNFGGQNNQTHTAPTEQHGAPATHNAPQQTHAAPASHPAPASHAAPASHSSSSTHH